MDKKFLSAAEAAMQFGIDPAEFQRLVDSNELTGLPDRGSFKYRRADIEQLIQGGMLFAQNPRGDSDEPNTLEFSAANDSGEREDLAFLEIDEQALEDGATAIKPTTDFDFLDEHVDPATSAATNTPDSGFASDSEILMIESDSEIPVASSSLTPPTSDVPVIESLSELDIVIADTPNSPADSQLTNESSVIISGSGGDSQLDSDSDVKVVKVVKDPAESSSVNPAGKTDHVMLGDSSVISPAEMASGITSSDSDVRIADSGISLERLDSGILLDSGITLDSGVNLNQDSGLTLEMDSGIRLEPDSGLTLDSAMDSGISLEGDDSGLSLADGDSGIALAGNKPAGRAFKPDDTQAEFDELVTGSSGDHTAMIESFDDDSESLETIAPTKAKKARRPGLSDSFDSVDEVEDLEIVDDLAAGELDVEAADEFDDDEPEDILDASDDAFSIAEEGGLSDESSVASIPAIKAVAKEPSWGIVAVLPIAACALLLLVQALILWDGISTMWAGNTSQAIGVSIIDALGDLM